MGLITAGLELLAVVISLFALRRYLNKKKLALAEELNKNAADAGGETK
jgi:hypothetical protein